MLPSMTMFKKLERSDIIVAAHSRNCSSVSRKCSHCLLALPSLPLPSAQVLDELSTREFLHRLNFIGISHVSSVAPKVLDDLCTREFLHRLTLIGISHVPQVQATYYTYSVAEQLVELDAYQASQNMKIDPEEHVVALDKAIGKTRLFHIGMKVDSSSRFPISYYIKKSFPVDNAQLHPSTESSSGKPQISHPSSSLNVQSTTIHTPGDSDNNTPSFDQTTNIDTQINQTNNQAKRRLEFSGDDEANNDRQEAPKLPEPQSHLHAPKRHKDIADNSPSPSIEKSI